MPKRSQYWEEGLSESLIENEDERREYFFSLMEEGFTWRESLKILIESIGIKEYSILSDIKAPNLISQLSEDKDIRISTLEKMVRPLNISLSFQESNKSA